MHNVHRSIVAIVSTLLVAGFATHAAAQNYPFNKAANIISILREYEMKSKGYETSATPEGELMKEMLFRIMH